MALHNRVYKIGNNQYNEWLAGEFGNAWNDEHTKVGGFSNIVRLYGMPYLSIMGQIHGPTQLSFYASTNGKRFYYCATITALINPQEPPAPSWDTSVRYELGDEVTYLGVRYDCILAHVSNAARVPPNPTYWVVNPGTYPRMFHFYPVIGAEYVRMRSKNDVIATVSIMAKRSF